MARQSHRRHKTLTAEQVWPLLADFCNFHKWFPIIDTCYRVDGDFGQPGLIRYCGVTPQESSTFSSDDDQMNKIKWDKEKLLMIDPSGRCLRYETVENNMGFKSYVGTFKVISIDGGDCKGGCMIEWSFVGDPIEGWRLDDYASYVDSAGIQLMARKMEDAFQSYGGI